MARITGFGESLCPSLSGLCELRIVSESRSFISFWALRTCRHPGRIGHCLHPNTFLHPTWRNGPFGLTLFVEDPMSIDVTRHRWFTLDTLKALIASSGFKVTSSRALPV